MIFFEKKSWYSLEKCKEKKMEYLKWAYFRVQILRILAIFARLNAREKFWTGLFTKLNPREKCGENWKIESRRFVSSSFFFFLSLVKKTKWIQENLFSSIVLHFIFKGFSSLEPKKKTFQTVTNIGIFYIYGRENKRTNFWFFGK